MDAYYVLIKYRIFFKDNLDLKLDHLVVISEVTGIGLIIAEPVLT